VLLVSLTPRARHTIMTPDDINWVVGDKSVDNDDLTHLAESVYWAIKDADSWTVCEQRILNQVDELDQDALVEIGKRTDLLRRRADADTVCWTVTVD